jgi:hypothetical protein
MSLLQGSQHWRLMPIVKYFTILILGIIIIKVPLASMLTLLTIKYEMFHTCSYVECIRYMHKNIKKCLHISTTLKTGKRNTNLSPYQSHLLGIKFKRIMQHTSMNEHTDMRVVATFSNQTIQ